MRIVEIERILAIFDCNLCVKEAAEKMHISRSGMGMTLRQVERELGYELIDRNVGCNAKLYIKITEKGEKAREVFRRMVDSYNMLK